MPGYRSIPRWKVATGMTLLALLAPITVPDQATAQTLEDLPYARAALEEEPFESDGTLLVSASPKLELVMIVRSLADAGRVFQRSITDENSIGVYWLNNTRQFSFEKAPQHLRELRLQGLWGDRLLELAMHLSEPPALTRLRPWSDRLLAVAGGLPDETPEKRLDRFVDELREFAERSRFVERFTEKAADYRLLEETIERTLAGQDPVATNLDFWGLDPQGGFHLLPSPMMSGGTMASVELEGRTHHFLAFGPAVVSVLANQGFMEHLVYHELSHPLVDPLLAEADLDGSSRLWFAVSAEMSGQQNVLTWNDCVGEHLLRAYNIRLLRDSDPVLAELSVTVEESAGFLYVRPFIEILDAYDAARGEGKGFDDFMPTFTARLDELASRAAELNPSSRPPEFEVRNGGFESDSPSWLLEHWSLVRSGTVPINMEATRTAIARDAQVAHEGDASARITVTDTTRDLIALEQGPLAVRAGGSVRISAWIKTDGVERHESQQQICGLYVLFLDRRGEVLSRGETDSAVGTLDWTRLSGEFVAPAGTAHARLGILLGMSGTAWFDDLALERLD